MNILKKRPLSLILCIMLGGFSIFIDFALVNKIIIASLAMALSAALFFIRNIKWSRNKLLHISLIAFSVSVLLSALWSMLFYPTKYYDEKCEITGTITDVDYSGEYTTTVTVKCDKINGKSHNYKLLCYVDKGCVMSNQEFSKVSFIGIIEEFSSTENGFGGKTYYASRGYSATVDDIDDLQVIKENSDPVAKFFSSLSKNISDTLKLRTNFETGALLSALITGDRSDLDANTRLNFSRIGISHILALSGMHLAILSIAITKLLSTLGVGKKCRTVIVIILTVFYISLTGFPTSVIRAGVMLIITGILYLIKQKSDPITSLFIAVALIIAPSPHAVYDLSLWLSAFATLGVIISSEVASKPGGDIGAIKRIVILMRDGLLVSLFAFGATIAICMLRFDAFSIASAFTTLIFAPLIEILVYGGLLILLIGKIIPFGGILVLLSDFIKELAELISDIRWIYVTINSPAVKILIVLFTVALFSFIALPFKRKRESLIAIFALLLSVFITAEVYSLVIRYDDRITYAPDADGDIFYMSSNGEIAVIYSGNQGKRGARVFTDFISDIGVTYVDSLVLPNYAYKTLEFVEYAIAYSKIDTIILPTPKTDYEIGISIELSELLSLSGAELLFTNDGEFLGFGENTYRLYDRNPYVYGEYPKNVFAISRDDERYVYISACDYENINAESKMLLYQSEDIFIGTLGNSVYYHFDFLLPSAKHIYYSDEARISTDAKEYYDKKGVSTKYVETPFDICD